MKVTCTEIGAANKVDIARPTPRYCCAALRWVPPDKAYSAITAKLFRYPTDLSDLLAGWEHFQTLDDAALRHRKLPTMSWLEQFVPNGTNFWSDLAVPTIAKGALAITYRLYKALLSSDPALEHTRTLLTELAEKGMLISDDQLLRRCSNTSYQHVNAARVDSIGLLCGRIESGALDINLQSYLAYFREHDRKLNVIVTSLANVSDLESRSLLDLKHRSHCDLAYVDARSRHDIAQNLIGHGVPPDRAMFALFGLGRKGCNLGALKNALLLKCPSQGLMICDSSTVCAPVWHPCAGHLPKLRVTRGEAEAYHFLPPDGGTSSICGGSDLIAAHEKGLGKLASQVVADFHATGHVVFESACCHLLHSLWHGNGHVVATTNGVLSVLDHISPELARSISTAKRNHFGDGRLTDDSWRGKLLLNSAGCYTLGHESPVGDHCLCLDTSANLPPFLPVGRDDQQMFFLTLFCCFPYSYVLSVPCGLPMKRKPHDQSACNRDYIPQLRDLLIPCMTSSKLRSDDDEYDKAIGEGLQTLARLPAQEFREQVRSVVKESFEHDASRSQPPSDFRRQHASLSRMIDAYTDSRNQIIHGPQLFNVADVAVGSCLDDKAIAVQEIFMRFGDLLKSWTDILEIGSQSYTPNCEAPKTRTGQWGA